LLVHQVHGLLPCFDVFPQRSHRRRCDGSWSLGDVGITEDIKRGLRQSLVERRRPTFLAATVREM
jgi:hypothetical protein